MGHKNFYLVKRKGEIERERKKEAGKGTRVRTDRHPLLLVGRIRDVIIHMIGPST